MTRMLRLIIAQQSALSDVTPAHGLHAERGPGAVDGHVPNCIVSVIRSELERWTNLKVVVKAFAYDLLRRQG